MVVCGAAAQLTGPCVRRVMRCNIFGGNALRSTGQRHLAGNDDSRRSASTLILLRHGKSIWNGDSARFTGWCDIPLTVQGRVEAVAALERSHETCELALASMAGHEQETWSSERIRREWKLNERHYGCVQGRFKNDPDLVKEYGEETLVQWRRSLHGKPPPMDTSHPYYLPPPAPLTESLADCQRRVVSCWEESISNALFDEEDLPVPPDERTIMVVAHANTIRALMAHFDDVEEEQVPNLYVPNSVPILYDFCRATRKPVEEKLESAAGTSHARWMLSPENHHHVRKAISTGGMLTRALFDAMDTTRDGALCRTELEAGIRELLRPDAGPVARDCVVVDVAKKCAFEMSPEEYISYEEFERRTTEAYDEIRFMESLYEDDHEIGAWV
eukprot:CAMPEP_0178723952 /NCGR_PEP_ID=MMETSP0699-20121125/25835_1 /TAXON_ID=265572 /ORGANISM="Extubocellulus spinifer, Strain CCMP396" /LENGTH=387 /DNA_ID=CAMNT_0020375095 /DNA_START=57 /DNA_END=1220 /DNA_ORIENTATION=-